QARVGPLLGHSLSSPVSGEIPSRFGPRYWPQSGTPAESFSFLDWPNESGAVAARISSRNTTRPRFFFTVKVSKIGSRCSLPYYAIHAPGSPFRIPGRQTPPPPFRYPKYRLRHSRRTYNTGGNGKVGGLADIEWMEMAERVKILPFVVLAVV